MCWREADLKWSSAPLQDFFPAPPASHFARVRHTYTHTHTTRGHRNKESVMCAARAKWQTCPVVSARSSCELICYTDFQHSRKKQIKTKKRKIKKLLFLLFCTFCPLEVRHWPRSEFGQNVRLSIVVFWMHHIRYFSVLKEITAQPTTNILSFE